MVRLILGRGGSVEPLASPGPHFLLPLVLQCVDLSCNELSEVTLPENLPPKLQELDLTGNPRLALDHKTLELLK